MSVIELWAPILLSGLAMHILSTVAWMALPHHKPEWLRLPNEDEFIKFLDDGKVEAEQYLFPFSRDPKEVQSEEYQKKQNTCRGMLVMWKSPPNMGLAIAQTFVFFLVTAFVIGYVASNGVEVGASFMDVFQFVTTVGLLAHCAGKFPTVFWFKRRFAMDLVDGVAYAIVTGLIFAFLWPSGS